MSILPSELPVVRLTDEELVRALYEAVGRIGDEAEYLEELRDDMYRLIEEALDRWAHEVHERETEREIRADVYPGDREGAAKELRAIRERRGKNADLRRELILVYEAYGA